MTSLGLQERILEMVTSGKSGVAAGQDRSITRIPASSGVSGAVTSCRSPSSVPRPGQEHQPELADLHLVAVGCTAESTGSPVDVGAVEAADVDNLEFAALGRNSACPAADGDVVEKMSLSGCRPAEVLA